MTLLAGTSPIKNCGTGTNVAAAGTAWTNPGSIAVASQFARSNPIIATGNSDNLAATNFGFAVPAAATVLGVQMSFIRSGLRTDILDNGIYLTKNGTATVGADHSSGDIWPVIPAAQNYGTTTDLWGTTLSVAEVNASTFGVLIQALNVNETHSSSATIRAFVTMTVTYSSQAKGFSPGIVGNGIFTVTRRAR